jgi:hypothetical protein
MDREADCPKDYICLLIRGHFAISGDFYCLLLEKVSPDQSIYRRIGLAWIETTDSVFWGKYFTIETITII